jgi:hypothetical protein
VSSGSVSVSIRIVVNGQSAFLRVATYYTSSTFSLAYTIPNAASGIVSFTALHPMYESANSIILNQFNYHDFIKMRSVAIIPSVYTINGVANRPVTINDFAQISSTSGINMIFEIDQPSGLSNSEASIRINSQPFAFSSDIVQITGDGTITTMSLSLSFTNALYGYLNLVFVDHNSDFRSGLQVYLNIIPDVPTLSVYPPSVTKTVSQGTQTTLVFTVFNTGVHSSGILVISLPTNQNYVAAQSPVLSPLDTSSNETFALSVVIPSDAALETWSSTSCLTDKTFGVFTCFSISFNIIGSVKVPW